MSVNSQGNVSKRIVISGIVQGVGFRPHVWRTATRFGIKGCVFNEDGRVIVDVSAPQPQFQLFMEALVADAPPLSSVREILVQDLRSGVLCYESFDIHASKSTTTGEGSKQLPPDSATCDDCVRELFDSSDRRFGYPFINCTNCGPRFTIIKALPYDRPATTMSAFPMCSQCAAEYNNPGDRRFHAQPIACRFCGPELKWISNDCVVEEEAALLALIQAIKDGKICAVKGLGGFHLMVDASNCDAVARLRKLKHRSRKPLAVMMPHLEMVEKYCRLTDLEREQLMSLSRPIVLLQTLPECSLNLSLAPGLKKLGVMLPYTPLHHLMFDRFSGPLVATSANRAEEPIVIDNADALTRLKDLADGFLEHNRPILSRYDDSIVQCRKETVSLIRRSRGYAPIPFKLPSLSAPNVLACGAQLKNTFCITKDNFAYLSQHIGDMGTVESYDFFLENLKHYQNLFGLEIAAVACDKHPAYLSTEIAERISASEALPLIRVQHHHAHIASCMVEHGISDKVIGVALDGAGYGDDRTVWGGEFLLGDFDKFQRLARFKPVPLFAGSLSIKQPWRMALAYLANFENERCVVAWLEKLSNTLGKSTLQVARQQLRSGSGIMTSSCGRLFDAVASILGICHQAEYEGQAASELESVAAEYADSGQVTNDEHYAITITPTLEGLLEIDSSELMMQVCKDWHEGIAAGSIALKFHRTVAAIITMVCSQLKELTGVDVICGGGGVFQNRLLVEHSNLLLTDAGFVFLLPQQVPCGDGGLALGQAAVARAKLKTYELVSQNQGN